jgi:hypothetical protein
MRCAAAFVENRTSIHDLIEILTEFIDSDEINGEPMAVKLNEVIPEGNHGIDADSKLYRRNFFQFTDA